MPDFLDKGVFITKWISTLQTLSKKIRLENKVIVHPFINMKSVERFFCRLINNPKLFLDFRNAFSLSINQMQKDACGKNISGKKQTGIQRLFLEKESTNEIHKYNSQTVDNGKRNHLIRQL